MRFVYQASTPKERIAFVKAEKHLKNANKEMKKAVEVLKRVNSNNEGSRVSNPQKRY